MFSFNSDVKIFLSSKNLATIFMYKKYNHRYYFCLIYRNTNLYKFYLTWYEILDLIPINSISVNLNLKFMVNEKDTINLWYLLILNYLTNKDKLNINHGLRKN